MQQQKAPQVLVIDKTPEQNNPLYAMVEATGSHTVVCSKCGEALQNIEKQYFPVVVLRVDGMSENEVVGLGQLIRSYAMDPCFYLIAVTNVKLKKLSFGRMINQGIDDIVPLQDLPEKLLDRITVGIRLMSSRSDVVESKETFTVCSYTNKVKVESGKWIPMEAFMGQKYGTRFTHGVCPEYYQEQIKPELGKIWSAKSQEVNQVVAAAE